MNTDLVSRNRSAELFLLTKNSEKCGIFELELDITLLKLKGFVTDKVRHENELKEVTEKRDVVRRKPRFLPMINSSGK